MLSRTFNVYNCLRLLRTSSDTNCILPRIHGLCSSHCRRFRHSRLWLRSCQPRNRRCPHRQMGRWRGMSFLDTLKITLIISPSLTTQGKGCPKSNFRREIPRVLVAPGHAYSGISNADQVSAYNLPCSYLVLRCHSFAKVV